MQRLRPQSLQILRSLLPRGRVNFGEFRSLSAFSPILRSQALAVTSEPLPPVKVEEKDNKAQVQPWKGVWSTYGWYPLVGLGGCIFLSKEIIVLNVDALVAANFVVYVFAAWLLAGDALAKDLEEGVMRDIRKTVDAGELHLANIKEMIKSVESRIHLEKYGKDLTYHEIESQRQLVAFENVKPKHAARQGVVDKLRSALAAKQAAEAAQKDRVLTMFPTWIADEYKKLPQNEKDAYLTMSIDDIGKPNKRTPKNDPVMKLFQRFFKEKPYEK